jgi:hypothetical protein
MSSRGQQHQAQQAATKVRDLPTGIMVGGPHKDLEQTRKVLGL